MQHLAHEKLIHAVNETDKEKIANLLHEYSDVFKNELGKLKGVEGKLYLKPNAVPVFCRARPVPFSMRDKVDKEIDRMQNVGMMYPIPYSDWATPVVPVLKKDGTVRLCGDYKTTLNKYLKERLTDANFILPSAMIG